MSLMNLVIGATVIGLLVLAGRFLLRHSRPPSGCRLETNLQVVGPYVGYSGLLPAEITCVFRNEDGTVDRARVFDLCFHSNDICHQLYGNVEWSHGFLRGSGDIGEKILVSLNTSPPANSVSNTGDKPVLTLHRTPQGTMCRLGSVFLVPHKSDGDEKRKPTDRLNGDYTALQRVAYSNEAILTREALARTFGPIEQKAVEILLKERAARIAKAG